MNPIEQEQQGLPSASEMHRIFACPGYLSAKQQWDKKQEPPSEVATTGTKIHDMLANETMEFEVDGNEYAFNDLNSMATWIMEKCAAIKEALIAQFIGPQGPKKKWVENRWFMSGKDGVNIATAKPDLVAVNDKGSWLFVDYKTGVKPVPDATANWQIATAAACVMSDEELMHTYDMVDVYGVIIQPMISLEPQVVHMTLQNVMDLRSQIIRACRQSSLPHQPRLPGLHCDYCAISHICPEAQSFIPVLAARTKSIEHLSPAQLSVLHTMIGFVTKRCEEIKAHIKQRLTDDPASIPGITLKERSAGYRINDHMKTLQAAMPLIEKGEYWKMAKIPTGPLRELWVERYAQMNNVTKKEATVAYKDLVESTMIAKDPQKLLERTDGKPA